MPKIKTDQNISTIIKSVTDSKKTRGSRKDSNTTKVQANSKAFEVSLSKKSKDLSRAEKTEKTKESNQKTDLVSIRTSNTGTKGTTVGLTENVQVSGNTNTKTPVASEQIRIVAPTGPMFGQKAENDTKLFKSPDQANNQNSNNGNNTANSLNLFKDKETNGNSLSLYKPENPLKINNIYENKPNGPLGQLKKDDDNKINKPDGPLGQLKKDDDDDKNKINKPNGPFGQWKKDNDDDKNKIDQKSDKELTKDEKIDSKSYFGKISDKEVSSSGLVQNILEQMREELLGNSSSSRGSANKTKTVRLSAGVGALNSSKPSQTTQTYDRSIGAAGGFVVPINKGSFSLGPLTLNSSSDVLSAYEKQTRVF